MTQYNRPNETVFASGAKPGELESFPDIARGWGIAFDQTDGIPPMEWFNSLFKRGDEAVRYLLQRGISEWSTTEDYPVGAHVQEAGKVWKAKAANTSKRPTTSPNEWIETALTSDAVSTLIQEQLGGMGIKARVRAATTANLNLSGLQVVDGVNLLTGDRVLVKSQTVGKDNGIYIANTGAWARSNDADTSPEMTPGMLVAVEQGAGHADSIWQLTTDGPVTLGTTSLLFEMVFGPTGVAAGTYRSVTVDRLGRTLAGSNPNSLAGYGIGTATQAEAEGGVDDTKPMSPLRVFQAISKKIVQASESVLGIAKLSTQAQTNEGTDDVTVVTPKKMLFGFDRSFGTTGYILFPSWLGGFMIQWGTTSSASVVFPRPFPTQCLRVLPQITNWNATTAAATQYFAITNRTTTGFTLAVAASPQAIEWIAIGN